MRYLLAILLPPVAVASCGRPFSAVLNFFLWLLFWIPGAVHACLIVSEYKQDLRQAQLVYALRRRRSS